MRWLNPRLERLGLELRCSLLFVALVVPPSEEEDELPIVSFQEFFVMMYADAEENCAGCARALHRTLPIITYKRSPMYEIQFW